MEISVVCANASGALITGAAASTALKIRRVSDGYLLDWDDLTFKGSGWGHNSTALLEVNATNLPGEYRKVVVITAWTDSFYQALVHFDDGTTVLNFSGERYVQGGQEVEKNLDAAVSTRAPEAAGNVAAIKTQTDKLAFTVTNQVDANVLKIGGITQTGRDIGANVLLSPGTGVGQLDIASGVVKANLVQILAAAITGTAAQIVAAFTKFFDKASPTGTVNSLPDAVAGATGGVAIVGSVMGKSPATLAAGDVTGNLPAVVKAEDNIDFGAAKKTSLNAATPASVQNIPATGSGFTALGDTRLANLDAPVSGVAAAVWAAVTRTLTAGGITAADVWGYVTRSLTDKAGFTISGTKQTLDALHDLSATDIDNRLEAFDPPTKAELDSAIGTVTAKTNLIPASPAATSDIPSAATIATTVWASGTRTLTSFGTLVADAAAAVWAYVTRTITGGGGGGATAEQVWEYTSRSLTDKAGFSISGMKQTLDALHDLSTGDIDARIEAFDPPTKAEMDAGFASIPPPDISHLALEANVQGHVADALAVYGPTKPSDLSPLAIEANVQAHAAAALAAYAPATSSQATVILAAIASLNNITVGQLLAGDMGDGVPFPAGSMGDRLRKLFWVLCNHMLIDDVTGAFTAYKDDGTTPAATGTLTDDGTSTERSDPLWA